MWNCYSDILLKQSRFFRKLPKPSEGQVQKKTHPILMEFNFGISVDTILTVNGPLLVEKIHIIMNESKAVIHEALYDYIRDAKSLNKVRYNTKGSIENTRIVDADEEYERISQFIPKVFECSSSYLVKLCCRF